jgi:hypothetical protein
LVRDLPPVRPARAVVQQDLAARRDRRGEVVAHGVEGLYPPPEWRQVRVRGGRVQPAFQSHRSRSPYILDRKWDINYLVILTEPPFSIIQREN